MTIPPSWEATNLEALGTLFCGQSPSAKDVNGDGNGTPYVTGPEQWDGRKLHLHKWTTTPKRIVPEGCIFITVKGAGVGKLFAGVACAIGRDIYAFHPHSSVDRRFLELALKFTINRLILQAKGDIPGLSKNDLFGHEIGLPPLAEQRRIVAKIEELFSELDKGIETLKTAKAQLAVYRQAILKEAFEGKLTAGWRADHRDLIESSDQLLARVRAEREARYEKQLSDWKTAVQKWESGNQKDSRPSKPRNPSIVALPLKEEFAHLPELAEGWTWLRLSSCNVDVSDGPFGSNLKTSDYVGAGVRVVRLENIGVMRFIEEKESFITEEKYRLLSDHTVSPGDIVFSSFITERTRVAMVPPSIEKAVNKADCFSLRAHGSVLFNRYLCVFLSSRFVYTELESAIHGVGRPRINTTQLKELFIPVCSPSEQIAVMQEIDLQQSVLDELESDIETNLQKAEALRQSILKKAFAGELVPQDPSDEPASILLERIRAERAEKNSRVASLKPKTRGRKPRLATT